MRRGERGGALLEVVIALGVLSTAGVGMVGALAEAVTQEQQWSQRERQVLAADRVIAAMTLLDGRDLDLRLGMRTVGEFAVSVTRPEPALYRIAVARNDAREVEMLVTVVYRPVEGR
ncbi:MAG TPA: hypothetical protein VFS33_02480 [Gemmatimonadales bacterium]|nr:hypothetical protein [Gemmatimonadales bacterium]